MFDFFTVPVPVDCNFKIVTQIGKPPFFNFFDNWPVFEFFDNCPSFKFFDNCPFLKQALYRGWGNYRDMTVSRHEYSQIRLKIGRISVNHTSALWESSEIYNHPENMKEKRFLFGGGDSHDGHDHDSFDAAFFAWFSKRIKWCEQDHFFHADYKSMVRSELSSGVAPIVANLWVFFPYYCMNSAKLEVDFLMDLSRS